MIRSGANSTPTLIVNGKYKVTGKSFEDMLRIASGLIAKERARRRSGRTASADHRDDDAPPRSSCSARISRPGRVPGATRLRDAQLVARVARGQQARQPGCDRAARGRPRHRRPQGKRPRQPALGVHQPDALPRPTRWLRYWSHQPNRNVGGFASSANGLLSKLEPVEVHDHPLPGRVRGRGVLVAQFGNGDDGLTVAVAHLSLGAGSRASQLSFIAELLHDHPARDPDGRFQLRPGPAGDAAAVQTHAAATAGVCVPTFPSWRPQRAIDHILGTGRLGAAACMQCRRRIGPPGAVDRT